jgi:hypothetical protein
MEIKVYPKTHKDFGMAYLHFHVVSGGFRNLKLLRKNWGRQISYEVAIRPKNLGRYVSKYASKTPFFDYELNRWYYHLLVYKTQMHRFSCKSENIKIGSSFVCLDAIIPEIKSAYYRDSYLNPKSQGKEYHSFIEPLPKEFCNLYNYESFFVKQDGNISTSKHSFRWYNPEMVYQKNRKNMVLEDFYV